MKFLKDNIVGISSGGGHLKELIDGIPPSITEVTYITFKNGHTVSTLSGKDHHFIIDPHNSKIKYFVNSFQALFLFFKIRPATIISTGAGIAIPFLMIGHLLGSKVIFIETGARIYTASKTGKFIYKFADLFIVQYKDLKKVFPKSVIGSLR